MGMLYAKVGGNWVPITVGGTVTPPAYAGTRVDNAADARFGNLAQPTNVGYIATALGSIDAIRCSLVSRSPCGTARTRTSRSPGSRLRTRS